MTPTKLVSTNATETYPTWSSSTTYSQGQRVVYNNKIYESLINSNTNNNPETFSNPAKWLEIGPSNKWAMFDTQVSTQTTRPSSLSVTVKPGTSFNALSIVNTEALSATLEVKDSPTGSVIYNETVTFDGTIIIDWYDYFFEEYDLRNDATFYDIPPYLDCQFTLTLQNATGDVKVGAVLFGNVFDIGLTQYGLNYGIRDYSVKETDEFGITTFVERGYSKRVEPSVFIKNARLNKIAKVLTELRATPTVWISSDDQRFQNIITYGFIKDWGVEVTYPDDSLLRLEIEGLT